MIIKLAIIAIICAIVIVYLKSINVELAVFASICASIFFLYYIVDMLSDVFGLFERLSAIGNVSKNSLDIIIKVTLVSYVVEFSAGIIEEFGMKSLSDKLVLVGKIVIILLAVPVFESVLKVIEGLM